MDEPEQQRADERRDLRERLAGRLTCSIDEASQLLGVGRSTAYAAARDGSLPVLRISKRLLVSVPRLLTMLGAQASDSPGKE
jgi:excisionase family DNA binding protein